MSELIITNLHKQYHDKIVLNEISVKYSRGHIHGIVGENGSGKTTFFRCIAGLTDFKGAISPAMEDVTVSFLPAELHTYPFVNGMEFIRFCLSARGRVYDKQQINEWNVVFCLPLNEYMETYSTGMLKKLYLMVIILLGDEIILLDEPFNGLDPAGTILITELLKRMAKNGKCILVSSHILQHLHSFSDSVSWIRAGKLTQFNDGFEQIIEQMTVESSEILDRLPWP